MRRSEAPRRLHPRSALALVSLVALPLACGGGDNVIGAPRSNPNAHDASAGLDAGIQPPPRDAAVTTPDPNCPDGGTTSISGTVFAPNGVLPIYNVIAYVPSAPLQPFPDGIFCDRCGTVASGKPVTSALSDSKGAFKIERVPPGTNVPLVFQIGKWRRQITVPEVKACKDTALTDPEVTRLPKNRQEGSLPRIALATANSDYRTCLPPKLGIDPAEFGVAGDDKAVIFYEHDDGRLMPPASAIGPAGMTPANTLWSNFDELKKYDIVMVSGGSDVPYPEENVPAGSYEAITKYLDAGGRLFGSAFQYHWYQKSTDAALAGAMTFNAESQSYGAPTVTVDTTFPKGKALAEWLKFVDPRFTFGQLELAAHKKHQVFDHVQSISTTATSPAKAWASSHGCTERVLLDGCPQETTDVHARIVTTNTPAGIAADRQCGRGVHLDLNVSDVLVFGNVEFPAFCGTDFDKSELLFAFFLFDLASCIQNDNDPPPPPK